MYLKKNLVLCHVLGHFQIFCFKCTYSKAKQLRIVLRHGIRPNFLEIHLLSVYSYFCRIQLSKSTNIMATMRGETKKTGTGFCKINGRGSSGCMPVMCLLLLWSCQQKSIMVVLNILLLQPKLRTCYPVDCLKKPDTGLE